MASRFTWTFDTLLKDLDVEKVIQGAHIKAETESQRIQGYMQTNRPWTDRTGEAKRRLSTKTERQGERIIISLMHGVDYGIFLEMRWNQRYAIIKPTLTRQAPLVMESMYGLLNRL